MSGQVALRALTGVASSYRLLEFAPQPQVAMLQALVFAVVQRQRGKVRGFGSLRLEIKQRALGSKRRHKRA